jgi:hypothetical protein
MNQGEREPSGFDQHFQTKCPSKSEHLVNGRFGDLTFNN